MKEFRKPDLNAPRYRPKVYSVLNYDLLKQFKEKYPIYKDITYGQFKSIINKANELLWNTVIENRDGVELPESLGYLFIGTCNPPVKKDNVNFGKSIKYGTKVSYQNWDSDGKIGKIFYTNYSVKYKVIDRQIWTFIPCRTFKRTVAKTYPDNWTRYVKVENNIRISKMYNLMAYEHRKADKAAKNIQTYNEFDID